MNWVKKLELLYRKLLYYLIISTYSAVIEFKTVYQSLTIDVIAKCAFGIEINSLKPNGLDKTNKLYKAAIDTFAGFNFTDRWTSYFFLFGFYMFPDLMPISWSFPTGTMNGKFILQTQIHTGRI